MTGSSKRQEKRGYFPAYVLTLVADRVNWFQYWWLASMCAALVFGVLESSEYHASFSS